MIAGLCESCRWSRRIANRRGSSFLLCERAANDRRFEKYPRLPVLACDGHEPARAVGSPPDAATEAGGDEGA